MILQHKEEWPFLVDIARKNNLDNEQTIILLAYREVLDGLKGWEFRKLSAIEKSSEAQANLMAKEIRNTDALYQAYLKRTPSDIYTMDFIEYMEQYQDHREYRLKRYMDAITKEFT